MERPLASMMKSAPALQGESLAAGSSLLDERFDHDSCGVGFVASVDAAPSHQILQ